MSGFPLHTFFQPARCFMLIATEWFSQDSALDSLDSLFCVPSGVVLLKRSQVHSAKYGPKVQVLYTTRNLIKFTRW